MRAALTCMVINRQIPAPISEGSPYIPVITYTMDWPMVMIMPNTGITRNGLLKVGHYTVWRKQFWNTYCVPGTGEDDDGRCRMQAWPVRSSIQEGSAAPWPNYKSTEYKYSNAF